jgi:hypothetical protein
MNCHPAVADKTVVPDSCLTKDVLLQLKTSYNQNHPDTRIASSTPTSIWNDMRKRLQVCKKEDCWLNQIADPTVRESLDKYAFAPDRPTKWKDAPHTRLTNFDIMHVLRQYEEAYPEFKLIGPSPIDFDTRLPEDNGECVWAELCTLDIKQQLLRGKRKLGIVFNLDKHYQGGSHWVSMFIDLDDRFIFYMDSVGNTIPPEIDVLAKRIMDQGSALDPPLQIQFHENCPAAHQRGNNECGMYTLYFIITMLTSKTDNKTFADALDKIRFFKRKRIPDKYVFNLRQIYFNS